MALREEEHLIVRWLSQYGPMSREMIRKLLHYKPSDTVTRILNGLVRYRKIVEELPDEPILEMEPLDLRLDVHQALEKLPTELREVTILFFFQEVKQKEIAKILNIGLPLVKYRIKRAKELLAGYLGKEELP